MERPVTFLRRFLAFFLTIVLLAGCCSFAFAADTVTEYPLDSVYGKLAITDGKFTVLTASNIASHTTLLASVGKTADEMLEDWNARGVVLQAWNEKLDGCLEVRLNQDEDSAAYFDLDQQTTQARNAYRTSHIKGTVYANMGYSIKAAEWKKQTNGGRFLRLKYKRTLDGVTYWGYAAKTIRNGWTLVLDYQVYNRGLRAGDEAALNKIANSVTFTKILNMPATVTGLLEFTSTPPMETNTGVFTVEGTCTPQAHLIGVVMRYSSPTPIRVEADASRAGKFKMKVTLPQEGIWLMTLTVELNDTVIAEEVFNTTTFQTSMLPLSLESEIPESFGTDEFVLSGTTSKTTTVQCIVTGGEKTFDKTVRTNNTGKFTFKIPTSSQTEYHISLILQKKNYETRRFSWDVNRTLTEEDIMNQYRASAVKVTYNNLVKNLKTYTGKVMKYNVHIQDIQQIGSEWVITAAITKTSRGVLKDTVIIICQEEPNLLTGSEQMMYGICSGAYEIQSEEGNVSYPSFDLLFWDSSN